MNTTTAATADIGGLRFAPLLIGTGVLERESDGLRFAIADCSARHYSNAQIDNYQGLPRRAYPARPPLRLTVRAKFSHPAAQLRGTAGFGFWNQPFMPGRWSFRLPRYVWFFFGSPPHNMAFARGVPGHGWKAATADFSRPPFWALSPAAPLGFLLMRNRALYRALWPLGQWAIGAAECPIDVDLQSPHSYRLDWYPKRLVFAVDEQVILETRSAPRGPLGFVAWMDNQYAIITPQGQLGFGLLPVVGRQWLAIEALRIENLP